MHTFRPRHPEFILQIAVFLLLLVSPCLASDDTGVHEKMNDHIRIDDYIKHAETYYWIGMAERGNMEVFHHGMEYLHHAEALLKKGRSTREQKEKIAALRLDLEKQTKMASDTMYGVLPLSRLLVSTIFSDPRSTELYELLDSPDDTAVRYAAGNLALKVIHEWKDRAQLDVIFNSTVSSQDLVNEALYIFNSSPKFFIHNYGEAVSALPPDLLDRFNHGEITPKILQCFFEEFSITDLMVVTVHRLDVIHQDYFYLVEGRIYNNQSVEPINSFSNYGFCIDRREQLLPLMLSNVALLLFAVIGYAIGVRITRKVWPQIREMMHAICAFLFARFFAWLLMPLMSSIAPEPETIIPLSWWWPVLAVSMIILGPLLLYWLLAARLAGISSIWKFYGREDVVFAAATLGSCAYLAGPLFLLIGNAAIWTLIPLVVICWITGFMMGRVLDRLNFIPGHAIIVPLVLVLITAGAVCHTMPILLWGCVFLGGMLALLLFVWPRKAKESQTVTDIDQPANDLISLAQRPPYYDQLDIFNNGWERLRCVLAGHTVRIGLAGGSGVGKTATANALIKRLSSQFKHPEEELVLLQGACSKSEGIERSYEPFRQALAGYFAVNLAGERDSQVQKLASAVGDAFTSVVPFSDILFPPSDHNSSFASSKDEILVSIERTLRKLAANKTVVLFIDDAHWIDQASEQVLSWLIDRFGPDHSLAILLTGRDQDAFTRVGVKANEIFAVQHPTEQQRIQILVSSLRIEEDAAKAIVQQMGDIASDQGALFWMFHVVAHLAKCGVLCRQGDEFLLAEEYVRSKTLPVPSELYASIREEFMKFPEYRMVLECAACLGQVFNVSVLSDGLEISRLELLDLLRRIEQETHIIADVCDQDDIYAFSSSFMLEVIRKELNISIKGPQSNEVPQLIREYHARMAVAIEKNINQSGEAISEIARHYYAAGAKLAQPAIDACIRASAASRASYEFEKAKTFIEMANECATVIGRSLNLDEDLLLIDCDRVHVEGGNDQDLLGIADRGIKFLKDHQECSLDVYSAVARSCYEAARGQGDRRRMLDEAVRIGRLMIDRSTTPVEEAEGLHFIGLCLDQHEQREIHLRKALDLLVKVTDKDVEAVRLKGRITNSLAELMLNGPHERRQESLELFERSLAIRNNPKVGDFPGLARSHGGLGRYWYFKDPPDLAKARYHFQQDLELSERTNDETGLAIMHSLLGGCDKCEKKFDSAVEHYRQSLNYSKPLAIKLFAGAGLLECLCRLEQWEDFDETGRNTLELLKDKPIPNANCAKELLKVIELSHSKVNSGWLKQLKQCVDEVLA